MRVKREALMRQGHRAALVIAVAVTLLAGACTPGAPPRPARSTTSATSDTSPTTMGPSSAPDFPSPAPTLATLKRPLHFPVLRPGQPCPATHGHPVSTREFSGIAVGNGPVEALISGGKGDPLQGTADLLTHTSNPPWLGFKTLWFSLPAYQGPWLVRARRLDAPGPIGLGAPRAAATIFVSGPTPNTIYGYRTIPGATWVMSPGCYAAQIDSQMVSEVIVIRAVVRGRPGTKT